MDGNWDERSSTGKQSYTLHTRVIDTIYWDHEVNVNFQVLLFNQTNSSSYITQSKNV